MAVLEMPEPVADRRGMWTQGGMTLAEAVAFTSLSRGTLLAKVYGGELPVSRVGKRLIFPRQHLIDLLAAGTTGGE